MSNLLSIKRNPILIYCILVFIISWGFIVLLAGPKNLPIDAERSENLLPILYTIMLAGPAVSGILSISLIHGKTGFIQLRKQLFKWRVNIHWYILSIITAPILATLILLILSRFSSSYEIGIISSDEKVSVILSGIIVGLMVGLFEEIGWSGFLIPKMRQRFSIINTGLIVGIIWGAWHFILFWENDSFNNTLPLFILLGRLFAWLPPFRILMVWMLDRTESLLIVILAHASLVFTTTVLVPVSLMGMKLLTWLILWATALWIIVWVIVIFRGGVLHGKPTERNL